MNIPFYFLSIVIALFAGYSIGSNRSAGNQTSDFPVAFVAEKEGLPDSYYTGSNDSPSVPVAAKPETVTWADAGPTRPPGTLKVRKSGTDRALVAEKKPVTVKAVAEKTAPTPQMKIVAAFRLNVRNGPGQRNRTVGGLSVGDTVEVTDTNGNWSRIQTSTLDGWVYSRYLRDAGTDQSS